MLTKYNPFVSILVTAYLITQFTHLTLTCPLGWHSYNATKCLKYVAVNVNHSEAVRICSEYNSTLASGTTMKTYAIYAIALAMLL